MNVSNANAAEINRRRMIQRPAAHAGDQRHPIAHARIELRAARIEQIVADVRGARCGRWRMGLREINRLVCNRLLLLAGSERQLFDHLAIAVTRLCIHVGIDVRWIVAQNVFDPADAFKKVLPILGSQHPQTRDAVGDRLITRKRVGHGQRGQ